MPDTDRRLRLHRALDCIMDRVGYGRVRDAETPTKFAVRKGGGAYPSFFNTYNEALEYQKERGGTIWSIGSPDYKWKQVK